MIKATLKKVKAKIENEKSISKEKRSELLSLLSALESEITEFSKTDSEHAESITGFIDRSAHEVIRQKKSTQLRRLSLEGLSESAKGFETSHPRLVARINDICTALANLGI